MRRADKREGKKYNSRLIYRHGIEAHEEIHGQSSQSQAASRAWPPVEPKPPAPRSVSSRLYQKVRPKWTGITTAACITHIHFHNRRSLDLLDDELGNAVAFFDYAFG